MSAFEHVDTITSRHAAESSLEGRFDIIRQDGGYGVFDGYGSGWLILGLTRKRDAYKAARKAARDYDAGVRAEVERQRAAPPPAGPASAEELRNMLSRVLEYLPDVEPPPQDQVRHAIHRTIYNDVLRMLQR